MTSFDAYKEQLAGLPAKKFIGAIVWFTINEAMITRDEIVKLFVDNGLDERFVPNPIKAVDAFRRATSRAEVEYDYPGNKRTATLYIDEVDYDDERVVQHIFRKVRDRQALVLDHTQVGEAIFYRQSRTARRQGVGGESVKFSMKRAQLSEDEQEIAAKFIDDVHRSYERGKQFITGQALRGMVRNYVVSTNAISVRPSGGVYFVHKSRIETIDALSRVVEQLGNGSVIHTLPLIDTDQQRGMLTEAFQDEVVDECEKLLKELAEVNEKHSKKGGKVPAKKYAALRQQLGETMGRADEYTRVLGLNQERSAASIELAMNALLEMAGRIEH